MVAQQKNWIRRHPVWSSIIGLLILFFIIGVFSGNNSTQKVYVCPDGSQVENANLCPSAPAQTQVNTQNTQTNTPTQTSTQPATQTQTSTPAVEEQSDTTTIGEKNALSKALSYLEYTSFSYSGLIKQLEYEKFTHQEAIYGVDNCGANWNEQAALKAKSYLDYSAFSRDGLINQLEYEGFTSEQAEYGVKSVGY